MWSMEKERQETKPSKHDLQGWELWSLLAKAYNWAEPCSLDSI